MPTDNEERPRALLEGIEQPLAAGQTRSGGSFFGLLWVRPPAQASGGGLLSMVSFTKDPVRLRADRSCTYLSFDT